jgi:uncharacterized protein (TIGR03437 family)
MHSKHFHVGLLAAAVLMLTLGQEQGRAQAVITTIAGNGSFGSAGDGGAATSASLGFPSGVAVDSAGNVYIVDTFNNRVRKVNKAGVITAFAGNGFPLFSGDGGPAMSAGIAFIGTAPHQGIAVDKAGNVYITDNGDNRIRKVNTSGIISTFAGEGTLGASGFSGDGGPAISAELNSPSGVAVDAAGNVYIADTGNGRIRKVNTAGIITTVAGKGNGFVLGDGGPALNAQLANPSDVVVDGAGNIYIADTGNSRIRKVNAAGIISSILHGAFGTCPSGAGVAAAAADIGVPAGLAVDAAGNLYIADYSADCVHKLDTAGIVTSVAGGGLAIPGDGGSPNSAGLGNLGDVDVDSAGNLYIADINENRIRKVSGGSVTPPGLPSISANGVVNGASFQAGVIPNSWATIQGSNLASKTDTWNNFIVNGKLPTILDGVSVTIGGQPAYVYFISPNQINLMVPDVGAGPVQVTVTTSAGTSTAFTVESSLFGPAFFVWLGSQAVATRQNFSLAAKAGTFAGATTVAAKPGDIVILWGTGFGPTTPTAAAGFQVPSDKTYSTSTVPTVTINNTPAKVFGAALAPGFAGLYQVAIQVPATLADGDWPIVATIGGVDSPPGVVLSVKK